MTTRSTIREFDSFPSDNDAAPPAPRERKISFERLGQATIDDKLKRHTMLYSGIPGGARAVLTFCDLSGRSFRGANLADADFSGSKLVGADFSGAKLDNASFFCADLRDVQLIDASMRRADLRGASLRGANLSGADLFEADLREGAIAEQKRNGEISYLSHETTPATTEMAQLANANLEGARLSGIVAAHCDFTDAVMRGCRLVRANLRQARMTGVNLENADLSGADLSGADLDGAVLTGAQMTQADTDGANLDNVLTEETVGKSIRDFDEPVEKILEKHVQFVESEGRNGAPADLSGVDMRPLRQLALYNLTALRAAESVFYGLDMTGIKLQGAHLEGADLRHASLANADLCYANLIGANISHADLDGAATVGCRLSDGHVAGVPSGRNRAF